MSSNGQQSSRPEAHPTAGNSVTIPFISVTIAKNGSEQVPVSKAARPQSAVVVDAPGNTVDNALTVPGIVVMSPFPMFMPPMPRITAVLELEAAVLENGLLVSTDATVVSPEEQPT